MVVLGIGGLLSANKPLTADWLLAWCLGSGQVTLRTPAQRAFSEFTALFRLKFNRQYPTGMRIRHPKGSIAPLSYTAASGDFSVAIKGEYTKWPDISRLSAPVESGLKIIEECTNELESYSRFLGRNPTSGNRFSGLLLLPPELFAIHSRVGEFSSRLSQLSDDRGHVVIALQQLLVELELTQPQEARISRPVLRQAGEILERLGWGVEPDSRFTSRLTLATEEPVVLFPLDGLSTPSAEFVAETVMLALNALVIHADAEVTQEEERIFMELVATRQLTKGDSARLLAHARWLLSSPPKFSRLKGFFAQLNVAKCGVLARQVVVLAGADGNIDAREVKVLEHIYKLIGLDVKQLYDDLHELGAATGQTPISVSEPAPTAGGVKLDLRRIESIRANTGQVAALLTGIFGEEVSSQAMEGVSAEDTTFVADGVSEGKSAVMVETVDGGQLQEASRTEFPGLDYVHSRLLGRLLPRASLSVEEFNQICRTLGLLPGGAVESVNQWAYESFDEALIEENGEQLDINLALLMQGDLP